MLRKVILICITLITFSSCAQNDKTQKQTTMLNIGEKAPSTNSIDENGEVITLEQFKGKKVVLYFTQKI